jgi:hypothetical protein
VSRHLDFRRRDNGASVRIPKRRQRDSLDTPAPMQQCAAERRPGADVADETDHRRIDGGSDRDRFAFAAGQNRLERGVASEDAAARVNVTDGGADLRVLVVARSSITSISRPSRQQGQYLRRTLAVSSCAISGAASAPPGRERPPGTACEQDREERHTRA